MVHEWLTRPQVYQRGITIESQLLLEVNRIYSKCIKGESRLNPSLYTSEMVVSKVYQRGITIESQPREPVLNRVRSVSKGNHD